MAELQDASSIRQRQNVGQQLYTWLTNINLPRFVKKCLILGGMIATVFLLYSLFSHGHQEEVPKGDCPPGAESFPCPKVEPCYRRFMCKNKYYCTDMEGPYPPHCAPNNNVAAKENIKSIFGDSFPMETTPATTTTDEDMVAMEGLESHKERIREKRVHDSFGKEYIPRSTSGIQTGQGKELKSIQFVEQGFEIQFKPNSSLGSDSSQEQQPKSVKIVEQGMKVHFKPNSSQGAKSGQHHQQPKEIKIVEQEFEFHFNPNLTGDAKSGKHQSKLVQMSEHVFEMHFKPNSSKGIAVEGGLAVKPKSNRAVEQEGYQILVNPTTVSEAEALAEEKERKEGGEKLGEHFQVGDQRRIKLGVGQPLDEKAGMNLKFAIPVGGKTDAPVTNKGQAKAHRFHYFTLQTTNVMLTSSGGAILAPAIIKLIFWLLVSFITKIFLLGLNDDDDED